MTAMARLLAKVNRNPESGCWEWTSPAKSAFGYGKFSWGHSKWRPAHRAMWTLLFGEIPEGLFVLHRCDNPPCVNPSHLFIGTAKDNAQDMMEKGRANNPGAPGEKNGRAKLTWAQVDEIRRTFVRKHGAFSAFARRYGVSDTQIHYIVKGRQWH